MRYMLFIFIAMASVVALAATESMPDAAVVDRTVEQPAVPNSSPNLEFAAADKDGDNRISRDEAHDMCEAHDICMLHDNFDDLAGHKGHLNQQDYEAGLAPTQ